MSTMSVSPQYLEIKLEDNAVVSDIRKALKMIRGIASVKLVRPKTENTITPDLAKKIEKARLDLAEGNYTECKTKEELTAFLEAL